MKRIVIIALSVLLVAGAVGGWFWREWTRSPAYSLKQIAAAAQRHDRYEFEKYVDVDTVLQSAIADMSDGNALASAIGGAVTSQLKAQVLRNIEEGSMPTDSQFGSGFKSALDGKPHIDQQDRNAYFLVPLKTKGGAPFDVRVHMTQVPDGYWRIDRVANLKELKAAEDKEEADRKAAAAKARAEKIAKLQVAAKLHTGVQEGWSRKNRFQVKLTNSGTSAILAFAGHIRVPSAAFDQKIRGDLPIDPSSSENAVWEFDVNRFIPETERVYRLGETETFNVDIESVTYKDGTTVALNEED